MAHVSPAPQLPGATAHPQRLELDHQAPQRTGTGVHRLARWEWQDQAAHRRRHGLLVFGRRRSAEVRHAAQVGVSCLVCAPPCCQLGDGREPGGTHELPPRRSAPLRSTGNSRSTAQPRWPALQSRGGIGLRGMSSRPLHCTPPKLGISSADLTARAIPLAAAAADLGAHRSLLCAAAAASASHPCSRTFGSPAASAAAPRCIRVNGPAGKRKDHAQTCAGLVALLSGSALTPQPPLPPDLPSPP